MSLIGGDNIIANHALRERLFFDVKNKTLAHAYIIEGKKGSGRHTLVKNLIATMACERGGEIPCLECRSCKNIMDDKCADVMTVSKEDKNSLGIEAIRNIKDSLMLVPNDLDFKAYILEDADTMTVQAQNAFLLSLEQPPKFVFFFLLCENARSLLETIRSRAPILRTEPIPREQIEGYILSDKVDKSIRDQALSLKRNQPEDFETVLMCSDGSIGRAIELLSPQKRAPISELRGLAMSFISSLRTSGRVESPLTLLPLFSGKRDEVCNQLEYIKSALRDLIALKKSENAPLYFFADRELALDTSSMFFEKKLVSVFDAVDDTREAILRNANVRLSIINFITSL